MTFARLLFSRPALLAGAAAVCCTMAIGCQGGPGGSSGMPQLKNPFAKKEEARSPEREKQLAEAGPEYIQEINRGREMEKTGRLNEARDIYQKLIVKYPKLDQPYHRLGVVADRQKRYREAQALYSQAIAIKPTAEVFNDLGYCLYLQGKLDKAESALLKAVSMTPSNARYRNNLGMVYGHEGRYDEAMEQFRRGGSEADAYYNMAFVLAGRDDIDGAKDCFRLALAADPTHEKALAALASFEDPEARMGGNMMAEDGRRWESATTAAKRDGESAQRASYDAPVYSESPARASSGAAPAHRDTQAILHRARSMMSERMGQ